MRKSKLGLILIAGLVLDASPASPESLEGYVLSEGSNRPIPGLIVSLVNAEAGRSAPSITDSTGHYYFSDVPNIQGFYYLEIYWGRELRYRSSIQIHGNVSNSPIVLR